MGITGLLPLLKPCIETIPLKKYRNKIIGIDGHSWLYMIGTSISYELYNNIETNKHIGILNQKLKEYEKNKIKLIFVFDGISLPSKSITLELRNKKKEEIKNKIIKLLKKGEDNKAKFLMKQCISIRPFFINSVISHLRLKGIECLISPYETDAQLTYLQRIKYIDAILTEDSDFIIYGCTNILYKSNGKTAESFNSEKLKKLGLNNDNLLIICILSGCDYLKNIKKIGLKTAIKLFKDYKNISNILYFLRSKNYEVPENYEEEFKRAILTFKHQVVYDPILRKRVYLTEIKNKIKEIDFLGNLNEEIQSIEISINNEETISKYFK